MPFTRHVDSYSHASNLTSTLPSVPVTRHHGERPESRTGPRRPSMVCFSDPGSTARMRTNKLTSHSIREALRMYLQLSRATALDFYAVYKQETTEYDASEYVERSNENLGTTLTFVSLRAHLSPYSVDHIPRWSVFHRQRGLHLRHRCPVEPPDKFQRTVRSLPPSNSPQPQPIRRSRQGPYGSSGVE